MRLIDADAFRKNIEYCDIETSNDWYTIVEQLKEAPTVDAVILPCKVRDSVWLTQWWNCFVVKKLSHPIQRTILHYEIRADGLYAHFHDGCISTKYFGKTVFLTREEAEAALAERKKE